MSNKKWEVSVLFEHRENFIKRTTGGKCHIWVRQIKPTAESERTWIDGTEFGRDQVFKFQDVCKKLGLGDIGEGGTDKTRSFETNDPKKVNLALCMTKYAGKFGTTDKNEYEYRWWPADPQESINTRKCWRVSVEFTASRYLNSTKSVDEVKHLKVWVQQICPKLEDRHYVAGGDLNEKEADEYAEIAQKSPMNMIDFRTPFNKYHGLEGAGLSYKMFDSFETEDHEIVNKALKHTYYAGKFGTSEKTNYGYSWTPN